MIKILIVLCCEALMGDYGYSYLVKDNSKDDYIGKVQENNLTNNNIMGKMKEVFMEMIEHEYKGDHDAYLQDLARITCEEFIPINEPPCPNCFNHSLHRNETEFVCDVCAQEFIEVNNALRFK